MQKLISEMHPMQIVYDSGFIRRVERPYPGMRKGLILKSIEISWDAVSGTSDGTIGIYLSNSGKAEKLEALINVNSVSNVSDCFIFRTDIVTEYFRIIYSPHSITGGKLNIVAFFEEAQA